MHLCMIIHLWSALGFTLAFSKGQLGKNVEWIGYNFQLKSGCGIQVGLKPAFLSDLLEIIEYFSGRNVIGIRDLRSLAVKPTMSQT